MALPRKKLPIGIQSFAKLRNEGCYYVDKTEFALQLIEDGGYYFLSRPRRFGKSLFLDTLKELFEGNQSLFTGLYAENRWDWSVHYPVIRISFGTGVLGNREELDTRINELLSENAQRLGLQLHYKSTGGRLMHLIRTARETFGQPVVVLIDEYDKPILDNIENTERATAMREGLKDLYSVLKDADPHLKFVFLTGVSKFSKVSLFSGLNNLRDITVLPEYSALCGYTDADVDEVFAPELALGDLDREHIREWYNGYNWNGEAVYNPFDLLLLFAERKFRPYWYESGTPTFLIKLLSQRKIFLPELSHLQTDAALLGTFDVDNIPTE
ncbi:MAG: AAA family ATPase, partial [Opitutales bacterium]|nr:AAA family ATPase [Opitutales bacterium]